MHSFLKTTITTLQTPDKADSIHECQILDPAVSLSNLTTDPDSLLALADKHLRVFPFKDVKLCWRRLYTDASIAKVVIEILKNLSTDNGGKNGEDGDKAGVQSAGDGESVDNGGAGSDLIDELVKILDMDVIMTGAPEREEMVEGIFEELEKLLEPSSANGQMDAGPGDEDALEPPPKCRRISPASEEISSANDVAAQPAENGASSFQDLHLLPLNSVPSPPIQHPIPRISQPSLSAFSAHISSSPTPRPIIMMSALDHWPALNSKQRSWRSKSYLLSRTLGGRRLVPVEIGSSYTSTDWAQRIMPFKEFLSTYITLERDPSAEVGYLAQHHLLSQIPSLRPDISIPDYVYTDPPPPAPGTPVAKALSRTPQPKLDEPIINTWFGPAWTVSPLHHDQWHNLLCQVMGKKYIRLYAPEETEKLYPRGKEGEVDMGNTSQVDVEKYEDELRLNREMGFESDEEDGDVDSDEQHLKGSVHGEGEPGLEEEEAGDPDEESQLRKFPLFRTAQYVEAVLEEGEMLYMPVGWWHYVRSLSTSWSVSFWWN